MRTYHTVKINFRGGIVSPGDLYDILAVALRTPIIRLTLGLRQQLLMEVHDEDLERLKEGLNALRARYETDADDHPNVISSYPAEEVFIGKNWLGEGTYKDIFERMDYEPRLKINVSASNQSFTPLLTGNINWIASQVPHFWHLVIRFPKTNSMHEWNRLVGTDDVASMSRHIEQLIFDHPDLFYDVENASGNLLFEKVLRKKYITQPATAKVRLPAFNLPYYEGLNRYNDHYWLGIYRRDEEFPLALLMDVCLLCLETKAGQICTTPWKSLIIKGIEEKDRHKWNSLLSRHLVNIRHAANELNFQVQDDDHSARALKNFLVRHLNRDDIRTFGLCIGIKTKPKTEIFSSILVRRKPVFRLGPIRGWFVYDILCAKDFNPNERTSLAYAKGIPKLLLPEQLRRAIALFYKQSNAADAVAESMLATEKEPGATIQKAPLPTCPNCQTPYDEKFGDPEKGIAAGTGFVALPDDYVCNVCETPKALFS